MKRGQRVWVEWWDVSVEECWMSNNDDLKFSPVLCESIGWVIEDNENYLTLVSMWCEALSKRGLSASIPRGCIKSITEV